MSIRDARFVQGFIRMCNDGWEQGWHERNGGNLSYRMKAEEVEEDNLNFIENITVNQVDVNLTGYYTESDSLY